MSIQFGKNLQKCREQAGYTQKTFAEAIGISVSFLGRVEQGKSLPGAETMQTISNVLNIPIDYLLRSKTPSEQDIMATVAFTQKLKERDPERFAEIVEIMNLLNQTDDKTE